jgi:hypothetical protein
MNGGSFMIHLMSSGIFWNANSLSEDLSQHQHEDRVLLLNLPNPLTFISFRRPPTGRTERQTLFYLYFGDSKVVLNILRVQRM